MKPLSTAIKTTLQKYGDVRVGTFYETDPKREGRSFSIDYPPVTLELDDWGTLTIKIPSAPNPLFSGSEEMDVEGETIEDIVEFIEYTIKDALDGGPEIEE